MNHPEGMPKPEYMEHPITEAEIAAQSATLDAIDTRKRREEVYRQSIEDEDLIRRLGSLLLGDDHPSKQE